MSSIRAAVPNLCNLAAQLGGGGELDQVSGGQAQAGALTALVQLADWHACMHAARLT